MADDPVKVVETGQNATQGNVIVTDANKSVATQPIRDDKGRIVPGSPPLNPNGRGKRLSITEGMQDYYRKHPEKWHELLKEIAGDRRMKKEIWHYFDGMPKQRLDLGADESLPALTEFMRELLAPKTHE